MHDPADLRTRVEELERLARLHRELRDLIASVSRSLSSTLNLPASLARLCHAAAPLFGARRASAWMHDRRARELQLEACSDADAAPPHRLPLVGSDSPLATALRRERPEYITLDGQPALAVPLRGRRRALGLLVFEDVTVTDRAAPDTLEAAAELGRQISSAIENTVLFEDVLRSRRELEDTFNSLADFVIVCDRQLRITHANRALRARVEAQAGSPLDRPVTELVASETARWLTGLDLDASEGTQAWTLDVEDSKLGGHFSLQVTPLGGPGRAPIGSVIVARDLSEQMRLRAERAALGERLVQSEKLAALGQFVAGVAHELNNPLQGVLGHLELVRTTRHVPRDLQSELRVVYRDAERAARIVNNLLVFAGSRRGARRRVNLRSVVARTVSLRGRACRRAGITLTRAYEPDLPCVRGDAMLLQQALLNVLINAEQAVAACAPAGGGIEVRTAAERAGARAIIEVRDTGPGIPADALPRVFEPFFTTKEVGKGTGLGLALAYGIVQDHGGEISARNDPRGGAVFRIDLPADTMDARS